MAKLSVNEYGNPIAKRLHGSRKQGVSFWLHEGEVYRLMEYEPVRFNIYGLPMGARWECSEASFSMFSKQMYGL